MRVHLISRPRADSNAIPLHATRVLADALTAAGVDVLVDVGHAPTEEVARASAQLADELRERWAGGGAPELIHAFGLVAVSAAVEARPEGIPLVATFDEWPSDPHGERILARSADAVLALSCQERDQWRGLGVQTLQMGVPTFPISIPDPEVSATGRRGDVVTLSQGSVLEALVDAMPQWGSSRLVLLKRLSEDRVRELRLRAEALGVADRFEYQPSLTGTARTDVWRRACVLVAGVDGVRHGGPVLEAAANGVPAVAPAEGAYLDHVIAGVTGVLLEPGATGQRLACAVRPLLVDEFRARSMGAAGLVRIKALHDPFRAGERIKALYDLLVKGVEDEPTPSHRLTAERAELALSHLQLATQLARWYSGRGQSLDDLIQVASLGLVQAAERFDPAHGKEFHSFAIPTILGELRRHFRDHAWAVRVPRGLQETTLLVQRTSEELRQRLGHDASLADVAQELGLVEQEVRQAQQALSEARSSRSLDLPIGAGGNEVFGDLFGELDPAIDLVEQATDVRAALRHLPPRECEIILLRFYGECTQLEIAERLGISQVHVSRVLSRTLAVLRDHVLYDHPLPESWGGSTPAAGSRQEARTG